jgi:hypothetical protein
MYRIIHDHFWTDLTVKNLEAAPSPKLLYSYLRTCRHNNIIGAYILGIYQLANELYPKIDIEAAVKTTKEHIKELVAAGLILYDEEASLFVITEHLTDEPIHSKPNNHIKSALSVLNSLPKVEILSDMKERIANSRAEANNI